MATESAAPPNAGRVYILLWSLGLAASLVAASTIGFIAYSYATDEERRNPPPAEGHEGALPSATIAL